MTATHLPIIAPLNGHSAAAFAASGSGGMYNTASTNDNNDYRRRKKNRPRRRIVFTIPIFNRFLQPFCHSVTNIRMSSLIGVVADGFVYLLGPVLILVALAIISGLTYSFFTIMLPMLAPHGIFSVAGLFHITSVGFFLVNILHNYFLCVMTRNTGKHYEVLVRELADATGFRYPETPEEVEDCKRDYEQKIIARSRVRRVNGLGSPPQPPQQQQQLSGTTAATTTVTNRSATACPVINNNPETGTTTSALNTSSSTTTTTSSTSAGNDPPVYRWMLLGPQEWGFCMYSNQPKPPRSHYDHVTKSLVLNMDHYCPWMFNVVGYFNYRYFCNFLFYVFISMFYGAIITYKPFRAISSPLYREQIRMSRQKGLKVVQHVIRWVPTPSERMPIAFSFMLCLSVGLAVLCLLSFHAYLVFTAQTTVEFHGNFAKRRRARKRGGRWINPYDLGWKRNWQQVYGSTHPILAMLPSSREPEFLPLPIAGELGRRHPKSKESVYITQNGHQCHLGSDGGGEVMPV